MDVEVPECSVQQESWFKWDVLGIGGLLDGAWHGSPELAGPSSDLGLETALGPRSHPACYQVKH